MKIAILGPGALGCLLAARLHEAGEDVFLVDYRPERAALLRSQGIQLQTLDGHRQEIPVPIGLAREVGPADLTIMAVKAHQTGAAAQDLPLLMEVGGLALTVQNGLGNLEEMARVVGPESLLAGVGFLGVTREEEGRIIHAGEGALLIGAPRDSRVSPSEVAGVAQVFRRAGFSCEIQDDIEAALWGKLVLNVAINPLTALLRVPNGALPDLPEAWDLALAAAREAMAVAAASGITLTMDPETRLRQVCTATAANRSSMLQDVLAGRPTEIEALNGQVVARGATLKVPTPVNHVLTQLIRALGSPYSRPVVSGRDFARAKGNY
jgi:2-dehydropantoate 2-reductase